MEPVNFNLPVSECVERLRRRDLSPLELCRIFIDRYKSTEPEIDAFLFFNGESILKQAEESSRRREKGLQLSLFDGVPIAVKDNIAVEGQPCTCASKILRNFVSPYDATVARRLRDQGFVIFGRTNMDEFAMGSSCENSAFKKTRNPWNRERVPGGSSGGSAASVAARQIPAALGSDTGGSIRQPASFCGCVGLKPTYGTVSRYGLVAFASSLDQIGPIANNVLDAALVYDAISGHDAKDSTSLGGVDKISSSIEGLTDLSGVRIGLPKEYYEVEGLDSGVRKVMVEAVDTLKGLNAQIVEVSLPHTRYAIADYYVIATAEASANLARFDGIRYGDRIKADDLMGTYLKTRGSGFGKEVIRRIILGTFVLSSGYYDAYYLRAQKIRTLIRDDFQNAFRKCDVMLSPVSPFPAFRFGEKSDPLQMYLADIYTIAVNLAGTCAISLPADFHKELKMPVGMQFIGPHFGERELLRISRVFEKNRKIRDFIPLVVER